MIDLFNASKWQSAFRHQAGLVLLMTLVFGLGACTVVLENPEQRPEGQVKIHFIDVGQGDAVLIQGTAGQNVLYDGGRSDAAALGYLQALGIEKLDLVIASHPDADHIGGLDAIINYYKPRFYLDNTQIATTQTYEDLLTAVQSSGAQVLSPTRRSISLGAADLQIIPPPLDEGFDRNNSSVGAMIDFGQFELVLTGDAEDEQFQWWLNNTPDYLSEVEIYKSSHHGSKNGDSAISVSTFQPEVVVISVGAGNTYGHPAPETLELYASFGAKVYRTDEDGTVIVTGFSDGAYQISLEK